MSVAARPAREGPIVTLDGPAGSGKSTTAREVARRLGFRHLDSGALYRALTHALLREGVPEASWPLLSVGDLRALGVSLHPAEGGFDVRLGGQSLVGELRSPEVTSRVAGLAKLPAARACLLEIQRMAGASGRLVADGRDMGTVVFPDAEVKVFLVADLRERARRRLRETGADVDSEALVTSQVEQIAARDEVDSGRDHSPLRQAPDAVLVDTTGLTFGEQVEKIVRLVRAVDAHRGPA